MEYGWRDWRRGRYLSSTNQLTMLWHKVKHNNKRDKLLEPKGDLKQTPCSLLRLVRQPIYLKGKTKTELGVSPNPHSPQESRVNVEGWFERGFILFWNRKPARLAARAATRLFLGSRWVFGERWARERREDNSVRHMLSLPLPEFRPFSRRRPESAGLPQEVSWYA